MKRICFCAVLLLFCYACDSDYKQIKQVAYDYNLALANYDVDGASQFCTEETDSTKLKTARFLMQFVDSSFIVSDTPATVDIISVTRVSDTMAKVFFCKHTPIKDFSDTLEMRKRDGRWLAHSPIIKNNADAQ